VSLWEKYVLPPLINLVMQNKAAMAERRKFVPLASGTVLEVGIGSGINIPLYVGEVERLFAVDPSLDLWRLARKRLTRAPFPVEFVEGSAESIPVDDKTFDSVVTTWTLCTIEKPVKALMEMKRVLKPEGQVIFIEHGRSPDARVIAWQNRLNPLWKRIGGGCNLNRKIDDLILESGLRITRMETGYVRGPKPLTYLYRGLALRPD
jgi:ubiquinone/menaquinone biosynthesis C-methylase UbiE